MVRWYSFVTVVKVRLSHTTQNKTKSTGHGDAVHAPGVTGPRVWGCDREEDGCIDDPVSNDKTLKNRFYEFNISFSTYIESKKNFEWLKIDY